MEEGFVGLQFLVKGTRKSGGYESRLSLGEEREKEKRQETQEKTSKSRRSAGVEGLWRGESRTRPDPRSDRLEKETRRAFLSRNFVEPGGQEARAYSNTLLDLLSGVQLPAT